MGNERRFLEESFPVREVSIESAKEKSIRHGHISTLHIWWARRPLASSRATNYAALIPAPDNIDEWNRTRQFIIDFSKWKNSLNQTMIAQARKEILEANGGKPPKVLDPFGGGGAIPLEALRLGCETYSNDYNPVAVLIQKCTLEYPQKYGKKLIDDVKKWGEWVLEEAKKEIGRFYPPYVEDKGYFGEGHEKSIPVGYIWARTIPCQNPSCGAKIPLMRQFWLAKKSNKSVALYPYVEGKEVIFKIVGDGYEKMPVGFNPKNGTVSRTVATCLVCGSVTDANTTRKLFREGKSGQRMVAVVSHKPGRRGKWYRIATDADLEIFTDAEEYLKEKKETLMMEWGMNPVPDEPLPPKDSHRAVGSQLPLYDFKTWSDLFNSRQKLALITFVEKVRAAHKMMLTEGTEKDHAKAVVSYLALAIDRFASYDTTNAPWHVTGEKATQIFGRQTLSMVWDCAETNPFAESFSWQVQLNWVTRCIENVSQVGKIPASITQSSATSLSYPNDFFNAVFTDPPYYDNVPYSYLSDFFYVWLKRTVGNLYPDLFSTPLVPKSKEIVAYKLRDGGIEKAKKFFEDNLKESFKEINRVLKPNGIVSIVYAHKSTEGWETLVNSLIDSGLIVTGAWPLRTEMSVRLNANETASLASSIYIVARKMQREPTGFYNEVKEELKQHLNKKLERLWDEGISGADFFIAAIGSAIEVFGKYEKVMDYEGNIVRADRLLEDVRKIATDYAVRQILHDGFSGEISDLSRFYVLWRWQFGEAKAHFDDARKLAQTCGIDIANEWSRPGFIKKEKEFIRILGPQNREIEDLEFSSEMIDILHCVLLLWEKGERSELMNVLKRSSYGQSEAFYRVAQAVSETLPIESKEKKLLDGFLAGRERLKEEVRKEVIQRRLF